jgi:hypothetical protein
MLERATLLSPHSVRDVSVIERDKFLCRHSSPQKSPGP